MLVQYSGRNGSINQLKGLTKDENLLYIKLKKGDNKSTSLCIFLLVKGTLFYLKKKTTSAVCRIAVMYTNCNSIST